MTSIRVAFVLIFAVVQLSTAEYVVYGQKMTLDDNLSLNPNRCHHPLITQLNFGMIKALKYLSTFLGIILRYFEKKIYYIWWYIFIGPKHVFIPDDMKKSEVKTHLSNHKNYMWHSDKGRFQCHNRNILQHQNLVEVLQPHNHLKNQPLQ